MEDNNVPRSSDVIARLFDIIARLSEDNRRKLLEVLEKRQPSETSIKRKYPRKPYQVNVDLSIDDFLFTHVTQNVSQGGAFIETDLPFLANKELSMAFTLPGDGDPVKTTGKIVRTDSAGIGVKFHELIPDI
jgi:hypothetical protein